MGDGITYTSKLTVLDTSIYSLTIQPLGTKLCREARPRVYITSLSFWTHTYLLLSLGTSPTQQERLGSIPSRPNKQRLR